MSITISTESSTTGVESVEAQHLREFQETLDGIGHIDIIDPPIDLQTPEPVTAATQHFLRYRPQVGSGASLYVHPEWSALTTAGKIDFVPRSSRDGQNSSHGVMFGDLLFDSGVVMPVAVKPQEDEPQQSAVHEYVADVAVQRLGFDNIAAFGIILSPNGASYSLTRLEEELTTLDSIDWQTVGANPHENGELLQVWDSVARQAAMVHAMGSSQGDLTPRNIALRPDGGGAFLIDWEKAHLSALKPRDAETAFGLSFVDLKTLLESMVRSPYDRTVNPGIGLLRGTIEEQWSSFCYLVFDQYQATRRGYATKREDQQRVEEELYELNRSLRQHLQLVGRMRAAGQ